MKYMKNKLEMMKNSKLAYLFIKFASFLPVFCRYWTDWTGGSTGETGTESLAGSVTGPVF